MSSNMTTTTIEGSTPVLPFDFTTGSALPLTLINPYSSLGIPAYKRAVTFIADNLASFPRSVRMDGAKQDDTHPLDRLLKLRPNGYQNGFSFWRTLFFHAASQSGNGYARIERKGLAPVALHNLLPEDVVPFRVDLGDGAGLEQWYLHKPTKSVIPGADVIHISQLSHDGMAAIDPIYLHWATFQKAATLNRFATEFLRKGTIIRGAVEIPQGVTDEQIALIKANVRKYRGGESENDVIVLSGGASLKNTTISPEQSQMMQQQAATTKEIAQITGVPPEFLFELGEAKYNASVEQQGQNVVRYTFRPWIEQIEDELTLKLLSESDISAGFSVRINPDALLRGSTKETMDTVVASVNAGLRTPNEGRNVLELPESTDPEADKIKRTGDTAPPKPSANPSA